MTSILSKALLIAMLLPAALLAQSNIGGGGGGSAPTDLGPVIKVTNPAYAGCSATPIADYTTCITSVVVASNAAGKISVGTPTVRSTVVHTMQTTAQTSETDTINVTAGDTVLVGILAQNPSTFTVTDCGGNTYFPINLTAGTTQSVTIFGTGAGIAKACSGTITVASGSSIFYGFIVLDAFNVGSYGQANISNSGSSTTPTNVQTNFANTTTQDNNNIVATWLYYQGGVSSTLTQNTGTLQGSYNGSAAISGGGLITNTAATPSALVTNATISVSAAWETSTLELRSVQTTIPTIYFPYQATPYYYSSGLNPTVPTIIKGEPGSVLWYTGTAHAIDLGPSGLSGANYQYVYYTVDGLTFQGGGSMTQGIFINNFIVFAQISNNQFLNFGNATSWGVWANGNQNDLYITGNKWIVNDGPTSTLSSATATIPRQWVNVTTSSSATTLRFTNNSAACSSGVLGFIGCNYPAVNTPLISVVGLTHDISHNNFMGGFCPVIALGTGDNNTKISNNHLETQQSGCYAITFKSSVFGMHVINNYFRTNSTSPIGPQSGSDILQNATIADNHGNAIPLGVPLVTLNNLANQTGNIARNNNSTTGSGTLATPWPILHTAVAAGGAQFNADYAGACTLTAGACPVYTFLASGGYTVAPKCTASWTGTGTFTGILKVAATTTTLTITDTVSESTGVVNWSCNPDAQ